MARGDDIGEGILSHCCGSEAILLPGSTTGASLRCRRDAGAVLDYAAGCRRSPWARRNQGEQESREMLGVMPPQASLEPQYPCLDTNA
jgi:hypothetical protein